MEPTMTDGRYTGRSTVGDHGPGIDASTARRTDTGDNRGGVTAR